MTLGKGAVYSTSMKQKLNTKHSTKSKVVGVDNVLPQVIWSKYFLEAGFFHCPSMISAKVPVPTEVELLCDFSQSIASALLSGAGPYSMVL